MYDNPNRKHYGFGVVNAATTQTFRIRGPKGKAGYVKDFGFTDITASFTNTTTDAKVSVGNAGSAAAYGSQLSMGAITAPNGGKTARSSALNRAQIDAIAPAKIPADTEVIVTVTAPTGGSPGGTGRLFLEIDWDW